MPTMYQPGIPTGLVNLDVDYQNIQENFQQLDTTYAVDHYAYSDPSSNNGFHNKVTTPEYSTGSPPTTTTNPIFYAHQQYAAIGLIQYSRGPNDAVPTPLTNINSAVTGFTLAASVNVLDFTGISVAIVRANAVGNFVVPVPLSTTPYIALSELYWNGTTLTNLSLNNPANPLQWVVVGNVLTLKNQNFAGSMQNVFWSLELIRIQ